MFQRSSGAGPRRRAVGLGIGSSSIVAGSRSWPATAIVRWPWRRTATQRPLGGVRVRNGSGVPSIVISCSVWMAARAAARC